jgi:S-formylglutathione hydrolase FrmB
MLAGLFQLTAAPPASADAPNLVSSNGITVHATRWISPRILEADISTPYIAASAVAGPHRVRITLPNGYFNDTTTRYPVLYLLHGGGGANSSQWTRGGGAVEPITQNAPIITVTADGGKVGWYTNWVNQSKGAQRWADFYLTQLIPWVDGNLRTVAAKDGRAIAGLSMGGYGAIRLAQDRPDLFASVASFSGALKLNELGTKVVIAEESLRHIGVIDGPFGNPLKRWPDSVEPMKRAARLKGVQVLLYAGSGINDVDIMERTMGWSTHLFSQQLKLAGVPHFWWMYGRPGPSVPFGCDGGHNFSCWNFALNDALPRMLTVLRTPAGWTPPPPPAPAPAPTPVPQPSGSVVVNGGFEIGTALTPWSCGGRCGRDSGGFARTVSFL